MKICLATVHRKPDFIPLALLYLKAYLVQQKDFPAEAVDIAEFDREVEPDDIVSRILSQDPDVIGLSCYVWNVKTLMAVARRLKERKPHVRIVLGGPEVGPVARSVMQAHSAIDVIVKSEGERPFAELVDRWWDGGNIAEVSGICFRAGSEVVENADAPELENLNVLSSPHRSPYMDYTGRVVCIETQRGCVFRCNFCFYNKDYSVRNRRFDLDRVKAEIRFCLERDVCEIYLMDPVFNLYAERAKEICRFIAEHNHRRIPIHAEVWAEFIDEEMARLMRDAHFQFLEVGLQTTDSSVLATVERRFKMQKFLDGVGFLKQYSLPFELQLIYGLPGETVRTFKTSLDFAASLDPPTLVVFHLMVLPGTELWRKAESFQIEFESEPPYYLKSHFSMTAADVEYGWKVSRALSDMADAKTFRLLSREPGLTFSEVVDSWVAWDRGQPHAGSQQEKVQRFLSYFCEARQIPETFYQGFASVEFSVPAVTASSSR